MRSASWALIFAYFAGVWSCQWNEQKFKSWAGTDHKRNVQYAAEYSQTASGMSHSRSHVNTTLAFSFKTQDIIKFPTQMTRQAIYCFQSNCQRLYTYAISPKFNTDLRNRSFTTQVSSSFVVKPICTFIVSYLGGSVGIFWFRMGMQLAQFISYSWPYYPGKLEAASVLAQKCGEPATSLLLDSGLQTAAQMRSSQAWVAIKLTTM